MVKKQKAFSLCGPLQSGTRLSEIFFPGVVCFDKPCPGERDSCPKRIFSPGILDSPLKTGDFWLSMVFWPSLPSLIPPIHACPPFAHLFSRPGFLFPQVFKPFSAHRLKNRDVFRCYRGSPLISFLKTPGPGEPLATKLMFRFFLGAFQLCPMVLWDPFPFLGVSFMFAFFPFIQSEMMALLISGLNATESFFGLCPSVCP